MRTREIVAYLKEHGFWKIEGKRKHDFWTNGEIVVPLSQGSKQNPRTFNSVKAKIRNNSKGLANYEPEGTRDPQKSGRDVPQTKARESRS